jgi:multidrug efflux pump
MLSAIFVDRPRLAIVIAIVTTIAGLLALYAIPFAQYPDIVPPQVSVSTRYPGASAAVVDATIAQPIEAQVVGVDKMIYMKSVSGDDGSYYTRSRRRSSSAPIPTSTTGCRSRCRSCRRTGSARASR